MCLDKNTFHIFYIARSFFYSLCPNYFFQLLCSSNNCYSAMHNHLIKVTKKTYDKKNWVELSERQIFAKIGTAHGIPLFSLSLATGRVPVKQKWAWNLPPSVCWYMHAFFHYWKPWIAFPLPPLLSFIKHCVYLWVPFKHISESCQQTFLVCLSGHISKY